MINHCRRLFLCRSVGWKFLWLIVAFHVLQSILINLVVFPSGILNAVESGTSGLINSTLIVNLISTSLLLALLLIIGPLKPADLALKRETFRSGLFWTLIGWLCIHIAVLVIVVASGKPVQFISEWLSAKGLAWLGVVIGQIFGNALYEELLFRAFLIPQFVLLLKKKYRKMNWGKCLALALVCSQAIFALSHIPNRIYQGSYDSLAAVAIDQSVLFTCGLLFSLVFLLSRSIFAAIGIHALINAAPMLIVSPSRALNWFAFLELPVLLWLAWHGDKPAKVEEAS